MKKAILTALSAAATFCALSLCSFAEEGGAQATETSFWQKLLDNIWYIVLVVAFGVGLIVINRWSAKIKKRDEEFKKEYEEWKAENPEKAMEIEEGVFCPPECPEEEKADAAADVSGEEATGDSDADATGADGGEAE